MALSALDDEALQHPEFSEAKQVWLFRYHGPSPARDLSGKALQSTVGRPLLRFSSADAAKWVQDLRIALDTADACTADPREIEHAAVQGGESL